MLSTLFSMVYEQFDTVTSLQRREHARQSSRPQLTYRAHQRCAFRVHSELGPGLLEQAYKLAFAKELLMAGLAYRLDVPLTTTYRGANLGASYFMDAVVENAVIVEIKAVTFNHPVYRAQLVTYLRLTGLPVGLLMNFHARRMKDGISRVLNDGLRPEKEPY